MTNRENRGIRKKRDKKEDRETTLRLNTLRLRISNFIMNSLPGIFSPRATAVSSPGSSASP